MPNLADLILNDISPYDTGDCCIWVACKLNNIDKHRVLIAVVSIQKITGIDLENPRNGIVYKRNTITLSQGRGIIYARLPPPMIITNYGKATAQILFGNGQPLAIIPSLLQLAQITLKAIKTLELFFFWNVPNTNAVS